MSRMTASNSRCENALPPKGKVLFTANYARVVNRFLLPYLRWFQESGWETWVAVNNDHMDGSETVPYCDKLVQIGFSRNPFSKETFTAFAQLKKLFERESFDIVHTHTPIAGVLTRLAALRARKQGAAVIYTAHGFHFYKGAPPQNWLMWYPVERVMSRLTDVLITINHEDYERAKRFARCRVEYVPGVGVDLSKFAAVKCRDAKRDELGFAPGDFVVLCVGDLTLRKSQAAIVRALSLLPEHVKLVVCGKNSECEGLLAEVLEQRVEDRVQLLGFRGDMADIMAACDCLVFPSDLEKMPVTMIEAMASGLPVVTGPIRHIDPDLLKDGENSMLLGPVSSEGIAHAITSLISDSALCKRLAQRAACDVVAFGLDRVLDAESRVYSQGGGRLMTRIELGCSEGDVLLLSVGDLNRNKNHEVLVRALPELPGRYRLAIAGEGPLRSKLGSLAAELGVSDRLMLLGYRNDIARLMNAADLFCFPSRREGLPVSVIEAMATGTPCLVSSIRGAVDVLGDLSARYALSPAECVDWPRAIRDVCRAKDLARLGESFAGRAKLYSLPLVVQRYEKIYRDIMTELAERNGKPVENSRIK